MKKLVEYDFFSLQSQNILFSPAGMSYIINNDIVLRIIIATTYLSEKLT